MSGLPDLDQALTPLVESLEQLGVPYRIGGSIASSLHGVARATLDIDIVVHMTADAAGSLARMLGEDWYAEPTAMADAIRRGSSFNVIHLPTMLKVDVFARGDSAYERTAFERSVRERLGDTPDQRPFAFFTAEDVILHKLRWYDQGGCVSERQWTDIVGVMESRRGLLDLEYLATWATGLRLGHLLEEALADAGT